MDFTAKLDQRKNPYVVADEPLEPKDGKWEGFLRHDNVNQKSLELYPQPGRKGEKILSYATEIKEGFEWRLWLRVLSSLPKVYVTYESFGDTVEAEDVNRLQHEVQVLDAALEVEKKLAKAHRDNQSNPHGVTKAQVGLGLAENTTDMDKPVSTQQREAIDRVAADAAAHLKAHTDRVDNPHQTTKAQVGLGEADNTSDLDKPVSTAQKAALDAVAEDAAAHLKSHTDSADNPHSVTKVQVGLGAVEDVRQAAKTEFDAHNTDTVRHTTAMERTVWNAKETPAGAQNKADAAQAAAIAAAAADATAKANAAEANARAAGTPVAHAGDKANPHGVTKAQVGLGSVANVATNDQTPTFTAAGTRANLTTGEKLSSLFGKLAKWYTDLKTVAWTGSYNDLADKPAAFPPGTHAHPYLPLSGGTLTGKTTIDTDVLELKNAATRILYNLCNYSYEGQTLTGVIKIGMPTATYKNNTMMTVCINVFNYLTNTSSYIEVSGYNYSDGTWANGSAFVTNYTKMAPIRCALDGTRNCILIGSTTSTWAYLRINVSKVILSYGGRHAAWDTGWQISLITSETGLSTIIPLNINAGLNAATVNGCTVASSVPSGAKFTDTVYTLPAATTTVLGGVKVGAGLRVSGGTVSATPATIGAATAVHEHTWNQLRGQ